MEEKDLERLKRYDRMYADLLRERDGVVSQLAALKEKGRGRSATYQQLLATKLTLQNLIARFETYGIQQEN